MNRRSTLIRIFEDTQRMIAGDPALWEQAHRSCEGTRLFQPDDALEGLPSLSTVYAPMPVVSSDRSFAAARRLLAHHPNKRCAVLSFASPVNPGGGVTVGASAQEECLCRCSTLYPCLDQESLWKAYYLPNRKALDTLATDACIYTPDVIVIKDDTVLPTPLPPAKRYAVDVITCAAPNLYGHAGFPDRMLHAIHLSRARRILRVAAWAQVRMLVLGAFGCGAFHNNPHVVASAWQQALDDLGSWFDVVEFAIWRPQQGSSNYDAFASVFGTNS